MANASGDLSRVRYLWQASMLITALMMVAWIAIVPTFRAFAGVFTDDKETVEWAITAFGILFVPYVLFCFNTVMDSVFYGIGKTRYMAYQAVLTNDTVYLAAFLLYITGAWEVTFQGVMVLFSLGILVDSILTVVFLVKVLYLDTAKSPGPSFLPQVGPT
jgi:Na+-driven multidrug efflux pump